LLKRNNHKASRRKARKAKIKNGQRIDCFGHSFSIFDCNFILYSFFSFLRDQKIDQSKRNLFEVVNF